MKGPSCIDHFSDLNRIFLGFPCVYRMVYLASRPGLPPMASPLDRQGELLERWTFTFLPAPAHPEGGPQMERCPEMGSNGCEEWVFRTV